MPLPLLVAIQFLTTLPVNVRSMPSPQDTGSSINWYGVVGLMLGLILLVSGYVLDHLFAPMVTAAILLALWVILTGALHLDGLGDCADGLLADSRTRALEIMRDPRAGAFSIVAITLVLVVKFAALIVLIEYGEWSVIVAAPILGRVAVQALFLTTPYVRENGLASTLVAHMNRDRVKFALLVAILFSSLLLWNGVWWVLPSLVIMFAGIRHLMMKKLLGTTGDSAGALVEIIEVTVLLLAV
ncbi:MAG: adenosylcobinamide-GDP ribazoletransferase [marine bacterium B5-7]|nr:MAG: adenosylcobinamide-GDP ribazoletransferase [marine bacterium B5-7]